MQVWIDYGGIAGRINPSFHTQYASRSGIT
jgi:hypothetical protein